MHCIDRQTRTKPFLSSVQLCILLQNHANICGVISMLSKETITHHAERHNAMRKTQHRQRHRLCFMQEMEGSDSVSVPTMRTVASPLVGKHETQNPGSAQRISKEGSHSAEVKAKKCRKSWRTDFNHRTLEPNMQLGASYVCASLQEGLPSLGRVLHGGNIPWGDMAGDLSIRMAHAVEIQQIALRCVRGLNLREKALWQMSLLSVIRWQGDISVHHKATWRRQAKDSSHAAQIKNDSLPRRWEDPGRVHSL